LEHFNKIKEIVGKKGYLDSPDDLNFYSRDRNHSYGGTGSLVVLPEDKAQIQAIVKLANLHQIPLVPSGGRTGLCGGAAATAGCVVISLEKMNRIIEVNPTEQIVTCQPGTITENLQEKLRADNLYFPLSIASQGSSQIGGNIATNAGGMHFIRYGSIRNWVLGLEVVTGEGTLLRTGKRVYKDQTGIDLKSLFIGSEGTLGIITELTLALTSPPTDGQRVLLAANSVEDLLSILVQLRANYTQITLFEYFDRICMEKLVSHSGQHDPFDKPHPYYALIEIETELIDQLEVTLASLIELELASDVVVPQSSTQSKHLLNLREQISETFSSHFSAYKNDISLPISRISDFLSKLEETKKDRSGDILCATFGHLGDGNLHLNFLNSGLPPNEFLDQCQQWNQILLEIVASLGGSISAEHGIGLLKRDNLHLSRSSLEIDYMKKIKALFDPRGIMNPGKVFD